MSSASRRRASRRILSRPARSSFDSVARSSAGSATSCGNAARMLRVRRNRLRTSVRTIGSPPSRRSRNWSWSIASSVVSPRAVAVALRGWPSSMPSSPINSPGPSVPCCVVRRPCSEWSSIAPRSISQAQSDGSPCRYRTSPANSSRITVLMPLPPVEDMKDVGRVYAIPMRYPAAVPCSRIGNYFT